MESNRALRVTLMRLRGMVSGAMLSFTASSGSGPDSDAYADAGSISHDNTTSIVAAALEVNTENNEVSDLMMRLVIGK